MRIMTRMASAWLSKRGCPAARRGPPGVLGQSGGGGELADVALANPTHKHLDPQPEIISGLAEAALQQADATRKLSSVQSHDGQQA